MSGLVAARIPKGIDTKQESTNDKMVNSKEAGRRLIRSLNTG